MNRCVGKSVVGHPPTEWGRPEANQSSEREEPTGSQYGLRCFIEAMRPVVMGVCGLCLWMFYACSQAIVADHCLLGEIVAYAIIGSLLIPFAALLGCVGMKWMLIGGVKPEEEHYLWSGFVHRWDLLDFILYKLEWVIMTFVKDTIFVPLYLNLMGADVAWDAFLTSAPLAVDHDMLVVRVGATLQKVHYQGHTFEDRVLKFGRVNVEANATVGVMSTLLHGATVGRGATVTHGCVLMKGEGVTQDSLCAGYPLSEKHPSQTS